MRIARFAAAGKAQYGIVEGANDSLTITAVAGEPWGALETVGDPIALDQVQLLAPVTPTKVFGFGNNYAALADHEGRTVDEEPLIFLKPSTSVIGSGEMIRFPRQAATAYYEAELAIVIGKECRDVAPEQFEEFVLGYTCANDLTADGPEVNYVNALIKAKGFDTFCPLGPWIETDLDPLDVRLGCTLNGTIRQDARTSEMITAVPELVAIASRSMRLLPGDVILTGTPGGVDAESAAGLDAELKRGDHIEVWIEGIGTLANTVSDK